jgi:hypothetical protein
MLRRSPLRDRLNDSSINNIAKEKNMSADIFNVNFDQEIHCDYCQEVTHFHFADECPVCHVKHAGTDQYCSVHDCISDGGVFECQSCETKFKILQYDYCDDPEARIEIVNAS